MIPPRDCRLAYEAAGAARRRTNRNSRASSREVARGPVLDLALIFTILYADNWTLYSVVRKYSTLADLRVVRSFAKTRTVDGRSPPAYDPRVMAKAVQHLLRTILAVSGDLGSLA